MLKAQKILSVKIIEVWLREGAPGAIKGVGDLIAFP
jgi:hypothetical protein